MAAGYTLHAPPGAFRAFKILIAAEYNDVSVTVAEPFDAEKVKALSPIGKAPVLETPSGGVIFESNAIARHVAKIRRDTGLAGQSLVDGAAVDAWVDFAANEVELPASVWFYPVAGYMPFQEAAYNKAKADLAAALAVLNSHLLDKTYLAGNQITLADIAVASALVYPFKLVCDKAYLKPYENVVRWFQTCVEQPQFKIIIGDVVMCKKELMASRQAAPAEGKGGDGGKKKKGDSGKKKEKAAASAPAPAPKKVEHPYKIMDKEAPSKFNMDAWKRTYSNCKSYDEAMETFWSTYDADGWSLWQMDYNHNEENKIVFMCSNAIGGYQQRTDEIRRWAFGVMDVLGTEETKLEVTGVWLLRGDTVDHMKNANDDADWYTWTKLAGKALPPSDEVKAKIAAYWCSENQLEGKPIQDSKVFK